MEKGKQVQYIGRYPYVMKASEKRLMPFNSMSVHYGIHEWTLCDYCSAFERGIKLTHAWSPFMHWSSRGKVPIHGVVGWRVTGRRSLKGTAFDLTKLFPN